MPRKRVKGVPRIAERDPTRGEVYWFVRDEFDAILKRAGGGRISWKTLLTEIQALGLTNAAGYPLDNIRTLQSTFDTVRRDKQREAEAKQKAAAGRKPRPTNTPPPVVPKPDWTNRPAYQPVPAPAPTPSTSTAGILDIDQEAWRDILRRSNKRV